MLYNFQFDDDSMVARGYSFVFRFYVFYTKNVQTSQKTSCAFQVPNVGVQAMIFHENKVKLSVTSEKFAKVKSNSNERITF